MPSTPFSEVKQKKWCTQKQVVEYFKQGIPARSKTGNYYSDDAKILTHYRTIEGFKDESGFVIANSDCWSGGRAFCSLRHNDRDASISIDLLYSFVQMHYSGVYDIEEIVRTIKMINPLERIFSFTHNEETHAVKEFETKIGIPEYQGKVWVKGLRDMDSEKLILSWSKWRGWSRDEQITGIEEVLTHLRRAKSSHDSFTKRAYPNSGLTLSDIKNETGITVKFVNPRTLRFAVEKLREKNLLRENQNAREGFFYNRYTKTLMINANEANGIIVQERKADVIGVVFKITAFSRIMANDAPKIRYTALIGKDHVGNAWVNRVPEIPFASCSLESARRWILGMRKEDIIEIEA